MLEWSVNRQGMRGTLVGAFLLMHLISNGQEVAVRSFKDEDVDFREYKTYFWSSQADTQNDKGAFFGNDLMLKADIRSAVLAELEGRGYRMNENNPDLLVNFRVFERAGVLKGRTGYGSSYWSANEISPNDFTVDEINVDAGTLIISLLDRNTGKVVWQGFASGLIDNEEFSKDEGKIREAVNLIFEEYGTRANEYTRR